MRKKIDQKLLHSHNNQLVEENKGECELCRERERFD